ncbi:glycosyltransferase family 9 protein [Humidesulfovibrio sp.]
MNVLVLNLTRLGDLLQSQATVSGLAAKGHCVALVCLDNFAPAAALMRDVSAVFPLRGARLLARLDADWRSALAEHRRFVDEVRATFAPDAVINLTPSEPARLLARTFQAQQTLGFVLDELGFNADTSLWAAFLQLASTSRGASPFNIVDMFRRIGGLDALDRPNVSDGLSAAFGLRGPTADEKRDARQRLAEMLPAALPVELSRGFVALQLGASEDRRRWPVGSFAQVARGLARAGYVPVLLGTESEKPLAARLIAAIDEMETKGAAEETGGTAASGKAQVVDLTGATNLRELAATLCACGLLITNDTGTMHLAAGLGVPCLAIFLCTAQPWDTGPYLPGCISLEPDFPTATGPCHPCAFGTACGHDLACRRAIEPAGVLALAETMLAGGASELVQVPGARVWRSVIGADGLLDLESLSGHEDCDRTRLIRLQRALYRPYLDGEEPPELLPPAGLSPETAQAMARCVGEVLSLLHLLQRQGELLSRDPLPTMKTKFLATWQRVKSTLQAQERLALLSWLWTFEAERPGLDLTGILALAQRFARLLERMQQCVVLAP